MGDAASNTMGSGSSSSSESAPAAESSQEEETTTVTLPAETSESKTTRKTTSPSGGSKKKSGGEVMFGLLWMDGCPHCEQISKEWDASYAKLGSGNSRKFERSEMGGEEMKTAFAKFGIDPASVEVSAFPTLFKVVPVAAAGKDKKKKYKVETMVGAAPASAVNEWLQK